MNKENNQGVSINVSFDEKIEGVSVSSEKRFFISFQYDCNKINNYIKAIRKTVLHSLKNNSFYHTMVTIDGTEKSTYRSINHKRFVCKGNIMEHRIWNNSVGYEEFKETECKTRIKMLNVLDKEVKNAILECMPEEFEVTA